MIRISQLFLFIQICFSYILTPPFNMKRILVIGCGNLGSDVACHFRQSGIHVSATTTNITKINTLKNYANNIILLPDDNRLKNILHNVDHIFISVSPKNSKDKYEHIIDKFAKYLHTIPYRIHITFISSASAYGTIINGDDVDEDYNKNRIFDNRARDLLNAENMILQLQNKHNVIIFRPQVLLSSKRNNALTLVQWASGKELSKKFGDIYMGVSYHDEIINAYIWCIKNNIQGIININNPPFIRKTFFDAICDKYNISRPIWIDDNKDYDTMIGGNKKIICKKLIKSGYKFLINNVTEYVLQDI